MATSVVTVTVNQSFYTQGRQDVVGTLAIAGGNYATNGLPITWAGSMILSARQPDFVLATGIAGFFYAWDYVNLGLRIYWSPAFTPTGTVAAPTMNTVNDSGTPTKTLGELTGQLSTNGAVSGLTGIQAPAFSGTPQAAGALSEFLNGVANPAAVVADVINFFAIFRTV